MNYFEKHIGDYLKDTAHLSLLEHGVYNRLFDVYYTREAGIPEIDAARLIGARSKEEKAALASVLAEFFVLRDGLHVQDRCDREIRRYLESEPDREARKENDRERQRRARERRKSLFERLRELDIIPPFDAKTSELESMLSRASSRSKSRDVTQPVTRDNTATQSPDTRHQTPIQASAATSEVVARAPEPDTQGHAPTPSGLVCRAMKAKGLAAVNPGDPRLLALLEQGATPAEFEGLAEEAVAKAKGFAWVLVTLAARRQDAQQIALAPSAEQREAARPWHETPAGIRAKGAELGMAWSEDGWVNGEHMAFPTYSARVKQAAHKAERTAA